MSGLSETPRSERVHIAFFGRRNAGKSSIVNAITQQAVSIVSDVKGTTTDPVYKAMELLPLGPVVVIDTPGLDDEGSLGTLRVERTRTVLNKTDVAVLVTDADVGLGACEVALLMEVRDKKIPVVIVFNRVDCVVPTPEQCASARRYTTMPALHVSAVTGSGIEDLKHVLAGLVNTRGERPLIADLVRPNDIVVCVCPIDSAAPKGRLILPQQQVVRDILDADGMAIVTKETQLQATLDALGRKPAFVITDSQAFEAVSAVTPQDVPLTSFSIIFARYKGDLHRLAEGARAVDGLRDGDKVLIAEGCTHHRQKDDIGTVKIPRWLCEKTGRQLVFEHVTGADFPEDLSQYALIVHCGACMVNRREMMYRIDRARAAGIPVTNYGVLIATLHGIRVRQGSCFVER